jgi:hypothetical protein
MEFKAKLGTAFDDMNFIQNQINSWIIPPDYTSDLISINDSITGLFDRIQTLHEAIQLHIIAYGMKYIRYKIRLMQYQDHIIILLIS